MSEQKGRRRAAPAWLVFTLLRILAFAVPLVVAYVLGASIVLAAIIAAIVGLCLSVIFLSGQRRALSGELAALRVRPDRERVAETGEDELAEDAAVDSTADRDGPDQNANAAARPRP